MNAYTSLTDHFARVSRIGEAIGLLHWDMSSMMPSGGAEARGEQLATLSAIAHERRTDPKVGAWLAAVDETDLDEWQRANLNEMRRDWVHSTALPGELVEAQSRAATRCETIWREARQANDFARLAPEMDAVLKLAREESQILAEALNLSPYDALLDRYEPGGRCAEIDERFAQLSSFLPDLLQKVLDKQADEPAIVPLTGPFPIAKQRALGLELMKVLGFDFDHGRLDTSAHPFCGGSSDDVRITTRYSEDDFTQSLMGVIHETGHALYEMGLPKEWRGQPVGQARGMGLHESQSLLMEMQACRSPEFIEFVTPMLIKTFGGESSGWDTENIARIYRKVERGLIRVDADEVTYPLHVILRYRLERALLSGDLQIKDLPGAWNDGMQSLVGITPPNDSDGCMQDIHWMMGSYGYFPTYTLGAMNAAQIFDAATRANGEIRPGITQGNFEPLLVWLRANIHGRASKLSIDDLMTQATGRALDVGVFKAHLEARYLS